MRAGKGAADAGPEVRGGGSNATAAGAAITPPDRAVTARPWVRAGAVVLAVLVAAGAVIAWLDPALVPGGPRGGERPGPAAPAEPNASLLRFPSGSQQLAFIRTELATLKPEPIGDALPGRIAYDEDRTARVSAPLAGRVTKIPAALGAAVARGQPLAILDAPDFAQALADVEQARLELGRKRKVFERSRLLFDSDVLPRKDLESAETDLREAEVELTRAQRRVAELGQSGGGGGEFVLRSPIAGVVTERSINPGTLVGPDAASPLFVISDPARLRVVVDVPEQQIGVLATGQQVGVEADAFPGTSFTATVVHVGDVLDAGTRRIQVRCAIDNPRRLLKPEMYVRVTPLAPGQQQRVRVPNGAIVTAGVKSFVFVERAPGEFERRQIVPASQGREFTFVNDGLVDGERVVVSGALLLNSELQGN